MKNKHYRLSRLKHQLAERKSQKARTVIWKISDGQLDYITNRLHYEAIPYLYRVQTRRLKSYKTNTSSLLKALHHDNKQGKRNVVMKLSKADKKLLDEYGIRYWVEKYKIKLF